MRRRIMPIAILAALVGLAFLVDYVRVGRPVSERLAADSRNSGFALRARQQAFLLPGTLVLDLREVESAAPVDLLRGVFEIADVFYDLRREFDRVVLERCGEPVYVMDGADFYQIGLQHGGGENPVYMIRKFPSKLHLPDGSPAFGAWTGGLLGVLTQEMDDVNEAVAGWVGTANE